MSGSAVSAARTAADCCVGAFAFMKISASVRYCSVTVSARDAAPMRGPGRYRNLYPELSRRRRSRCSSAAGTAPTSLVRPTPGSPSQTGPRRGSIAYRPTNGDASSSAFTAGLAGTTIASMCVIRFGETSLLGTPATWILPESPLRVIANVATAIATTTSAATDDTADPPPAFAAVQRAHVAFERFHLVGERGEPALQVIEVHRRPPCRRARCACSPSPGAASP